MNGQVFWFTCVKVNSCLFFLWSLATWILRPATETLCTMFEVGLVHPEYFQVGNWGHRIFLKKMDGWIPQLPTFGEWDKSFGTQYWSIIPMFFRLYKILRESPKNLSMSSCNSTGRLLISWRHINNVSIISHKCGIFFNSIHFQNINSTCTNQKRECMHMVDYTPLLMKRSPKISSSTVLLQISEILLLRK